MGLGSFISGAVKSLGGAVKGVVKHVKKVKDKIMKSTGLGKFMQKLGPVGTIGLMLAIPYAYSYFAGTAGTLGTGAVGSTSLSTAAAAESTALTTASVAEGSLTLSEGVLATTESMSLAAGAGEASSLGALGLPELAGVSETGIMAASAEAASAASVGTPGLGILAPEYLSASQSTGVLSPTSEGFDWGKAAKSAAKSLLGGGEAVGQQAGYIPPSVPELSPTETTKSLSSASGGGLGFSKFIEEAQPRLTSKVRAEEERYRSLLSRGY